MFKSINLGEKHISMYISFIIKNNFTDIMKTIG